MTNLATPDVSVPGMYTPEMRAALERLATVPTHAVDFNRPPDAAAREVEEKNNAIWNINLPAVARVRHLSINPDSSLDAVACKAVVYEPAHADNGVIFFIHGGGWALCSLETHERFMRVLCNEARRTVVGVHYRLAPENPFPAALNDVVSAFRAVLSSRESLGLPNGPVVIAGDSAGANLAMATMLHEINDQQELPVGALLFYGVYGADFATPSYKTYGKDHVLTEARMRQFWRWYAPAEVTCSNPLASPMAATDDQLRRLPPLFLLAAEIDPLASDSVHLKERLDSLGRSDMFWMEPGVIHGFLQMTAVLEAAGRATKKAADATNRFMTANPSFDKSFE